MSGRVDTYDPDDNSRKCYDLAVRILREQCIRGRQILPREDDPDEVRWAEEGPRPNRELDTVRASEL